VLVEAADIVIVPAVSLKAVIVVFAGITEPVRNNLPTAIARKELTLVIVFEPEVVTPDVINTPHKSWFITPTAPAYKVEAEITADVEFAKPKVAPPFEFTKISE
jgi:hypothetical protein